MFEIIDSLNQKVNDIAFKGFSVKRERRKFGRFVLLCRFMQNCEIITFPSITAK